MSIQTFSGSESGSSSTEVELTKEALDEFLLKEPETDEGVGVFLSGVGGVHWLMARRDWTASKSISSFDSLWQVSASEFTTTVASS